MSKKDNNTLVLITILATIFAGIPTGIVCGFVALLIITLKNKINSKKEEVFSEKVAPIRHCRKKERRVRAN